MKLTEWYPASVSPARKGYYQRKYLMQSSINVPDRWDGRQWWVQYVDGSGEFTATQHLEWRGLASNPKKGSK